MNEPAWVVANYDSTLSARIARGVSLHYAEGASETEDRPAHVRAGSSLAWAGDRLVIVQDDSNFVALVDPGSGEVVSFALPAGAGGKRQFDDVRGNKSHKLDLEAVVTIRQRQPELTLAFGSGSTNRRESILVMRELHRVGTGTRPSISMHSASAFYEALRARPGFAGSELNVEGVVHIELPGRDLVRLFNRGNGAARGDLRAVNASADVDLNRLLAHLEHPSAVPAPLPSGITQYDLGNIDGCPLSFTDVAILPLNPHAKSRRIVYVAAAEASPDAVRDGPVAGCAVGIVTADLGEMDARWTILRDMAGNVFAGKVEGIALDPLIMGRAYLIVDRDTPTTPSELLEVVLEGPWPLD
jgi:hypothetical protein